MATAKAKKKGETSFLGELLAVGLYKRNQGRRARQLTGLAITVVVVIAAMTMGNELLGDFDRPIRIGIPVLLAAAGTWAAYRAVNYPRFADFLISVEAEMDKVTWPGRDELMRSTGVVLATMLSLGVLLLAYDILWQRLFLWVGILKAGGS